MTLRVFIWSDGGQRQTEHFAELLQRMAPATPAALVLGTEPREAAYVESLGGKVRRDELSELLRRCESENLQLAWGSDAVGPQLEVICELYDDHIEVLARPPLATRVEHVLAEVSHGAA